jgi:hypothetical protein
MRMRSVGLAAALFAGLLSLCGASCGGANSGGRGPGGPLPRYGGHSVELFDNGIEPRAFGYTLELTPTPRGDNLLRERTQTGDAVLRVRVVTITAKNEDSGPSWQIGLHTLERLAGERPPDTDFTLQVSGTDSGAGILRSFESRMIGKTFVAFLREFARPNVEGESDTRFHMADDGKNELDAIRAAALTGQFR